jgi:hypothetical protein
MANAGPDTNKAQVSFAIRGTPELITSSLSRMRNRRV